MKLTLLLAATWSLFSVGHDDNPGKSHNRRANPAVRAIGALPALGRCSGDAYCTACRNCSACGHCAGGGGTCGVCSSSAAPRASYSRATRNGRGSGRGRRSYGGSRPYAVERPAATLQVTGDYYVGASTLNLRAEPSAASEVVAVLSRNDVVTIQELTNENWVRVSATNSEGDEVQGYVSRAYLSQDPTTE